MGYWGPRRAILSAPLATPPVPYKTGNEPVEQPNSACECGTKSTSPRRSRRGLVPHKRQKSNFEAARQDFIPKRRGQKPTMRKVPRSGRPSCLVFRFCFDSPTALTGVLNTRPTTGQTAISRFPENCRSAEFGNRLSIVVKTFVPKRSGAMIQTVYAPKVRSGARLRNDTVGPNLRGSLSTRLN